MLLVYTPQLTNRVRYAFKVVFQSVLGVGCELTADAEKFKQYEGAKINYSSSPFSDELFFKSDSLLFGKGIQPLSDIPDDLFAMTFLLITRYEEYLPFKGDEHGRFYSKLSLQTKQGLLYKPIVNIKAQELKQVIQNRYPNFVFPVRSFSCLPTIDIDTAYAYKGRTSLRTAAGFAKALLKLDTNDFFKRRKVLLKKESDPFDTYSYLHEINNKYNQHPVYFFLLGDWGKNDKNLPHHSSLMVDLIKDISEKYKTGIHPSYASNTNSIKISVEKKRLEQHTSSAISKSKQHFLMLKFPDTYRNLIAAGITDDYSMGYSDDVGFRAGICVPFYWYDLEEEKETKLLVHPFAAMDATLQGYLKLNPEQAFERVKKIIGEVKTVQGEFSFIWHNETFSDWREWKGWKSLYEQVIRMCV